MVGRLLVCVTGVVAVGACALRTVPGEAADGGRPEYPDGSPGCLPSVPINHRPSPVKCDGGNDYPSSEKNDCLQDSDCAQDAGIAVCSCAPNTRAWAGSTADWCIGGNCAIDSDCPCGYCSPTYSDCGPFYGYRGYYCHTADDVCLDDKDCDGGYCMYAPQVGHWACGYGHCAG